MKANELTDGIYVYFNCFDGSKIIVKVTGFKDNIVYGVSEYGTHWCPISKTEPIPLNTEILEKNGFEYKGKESGLYGATIAPHYVRDDVPFEVFCDGEPFAIWFREPVNIKFVHEYRER